MSAFILLPFLIVALHESGTRKAIFWQFLSLNLTLFLILDVYLNLGLKVPLYPYIRTRVTLQMQIIIEVYLYSVVLENCLLVF